MGSIMPEIGTLKAPFLPPYLLASHGTQSAIRQVAQRFQCRFLRTLNAQVVYGPGALQGNNATLLRMEPLRCPQASPGLLPWLLGVSRAQNSHSGII
jgi:hypothetical protein